MNDFSKRHPVIIFIYFLLVFLMTLISTNPVILAISVFFAIFYSFSKKDFKSICRRMLFYLGISTFVIIINSIFADEGETILFSIGKVSFTLEELFYGLVLSAMVIAIFSWFNYFNNVLTSDKLLYLFNNVTPKIVFSLTLSMKFIPEFQEKAQKIKDANNGLGLVTKKGLRNKFKNWSKNFLGLVAWSFEHAMENASAMKARGYPGQKRSSYQRYHFYLLDIIILFVYVSFFSLIVWIITFKKLNFVYYPLLGLIDFDLVSILIYGFVFLFFALPLVLKLKEIMKWRNLKFEI